MNQEGRAIREKDIDRIQADIINGLYNDWDINRLFESLRIQRRVLREMFNLFHSEPLRLESTANPIRNSILRHFKELVSMEDGR